MFHGPREQVVPFFESMHFYVPERKAVSDFLQEVTSKKDQKVRQTHVCSDCICQPPLCVYHLCVSLLPLLIKLACVRQ